MNSSRDTLLAALLAILVMGVAFGAYYLNSSADLAGQEQTISHLQSTVSSLLSNPVVSTTTSVITETPSISSESTTTTVVTQTFTGLPDIPWTNVLFMYLPTSTCSPVCFGPDLSNATLFDCPNESAQGT